MTFRPLLLVLALFGAVAAAPPGLVDATGDFARIAHETEGLPTAERVARFKAAMATRVPGF